MLCTKCDTHNDAHARFCTSCGTALQPLPSLAAAPSARPVYTFTDAPPTGATCPTCVRTNPVGAKYCVYCATPMSSSSDVAAGPVVIMQPGYAVAAPQSFVLTIGTPSHLILRAIWFFFIGWWLGLIWTLFAWLFNLTLIGLPVGLTMLNMIPQVMTLRARNAVRTQITPSGQVVIQRTVTQPFPLRALWFVFIGWWASLLWMLTAWAFSASILLMPIAFWMFDRVPTITTLAAE